MGTFSVWHWLVVLAIVMLLFGAGKIPRLAGDLAKGIKNFKQGMKDEDPNGAAPAATTGAGTAPPSPPPPSPPVIGPDGKPIVDQAAAASVAPSGQSQARPS
jgi:sec-independent protein translocase protein TatA